MSRRVVVTGMGIWSCIGQDLKTVTESLRRGRCGIGVRRERLDLGYHSLLTGIVPRPELKGLLDRRQRNTLSEEAEYAYMSTREALETAHLTEEYREKNDIGCIFGNDTSNKAVVESYLKAVEEKSTFMLGSGKAFESLTSNVASNMSSIFRLRGINLTTSSACASSAQAIALATMLIRTGQEDIIVAGGAQETNDISMIAFDGVNTLSKQNDDPQHASRPFDKHRDGLVPSGGAATLVLEEYEHALKRGADILVEIAGFGFSQNTTVLGQPSSESELIAMQRTLQNAGIEPRDIDYINAHATSTLAGDVAEATALTRLLGSRQTAAERKLLVSSTKSMTGHECWMAGASEAIYTILMMQHSFAAPNINLTETDDAAGELHIVRRATSTEINTALSNSFGFGGTNCCLIFKKIH